MPVLLLISFISIRSSTATTASTTPVLALGIEMFDLPVCAASVTGSLPALFHFSRINFVVLTEIH